MAKRIVVTAGLPYANGDIHLGHLIEYIQADIWVRFQKLRGETCHYFCGDDTHGTPIMVNARKKGITPEQLIENCLVNHKEDFKNFHIEFDRYSSTHSDKNKEVVGEMFKRINDAGHIKEREIEQFFCEHDDMFLPDRFLKGTCPKCGSPDQYGDTCENCGASYSSNEIKEPKCSLCGNVPVKKKTNHVFLKLNDFRDFLTQWVKDHTSSEVANKLLNEWLKEDLRDWDITRDAPYFGIEIPGYKDKYFYVWVDAPICYLSTALEWGESQELGIDELWNNDNVEIHHFIGKDIIYFHTLYWPALLKGAGCHLPKKIHVHGMLMVNGEKMSKSKGTFINARTYLEFLSPEYLRFYYATKLSSAVNDIDLNFDDFVQRVNSELVGKITNLFSRGAQMLNKKLDGVIGEMDSDGKKVWMQAIERADTIAQLYEEREFSKAMQEIRSIAEEGNRYFDEKEPWKMIKQNPEKAREVLSSTLNLCRVIALYLKPVLPKYVESVEALLNIDPIDWSSLKETLVDHSIGEFTPLAQRIDRSQIDSLIEEQKKLFNF